MFRFGDEGLELPDAVVPSPELEGLGVRLSSLEDFVKAKVVPGQPSVTSVLLNYHKILLDVPCLCILS